MRTDIVHPEADKLTYEIREIVAVATQIEALGVDIVWENIGDPIAKGQEVPAWIKAYVKEASNQDETYAYSPTKGIDKTREFIAARHNDRSPTELRSDNILFFNGLGDAISNIYNHLHPQARVIGPDPAYPSHATAEATRAAAEPITYRLDPNNAWQIDIQDLKTKLENNKDIAGILLINPGNPTGAVFTQATLQSVVDLAKQFDLFLIVDAIYEKLRYEAAPAVRVIDMLDNIPAIVMRGMSKEVPWPGARCGWVEAYNTESHLDFARFFKTLVDGKMREVCSTTLPQLVLPDILSDKRWKPYLHERTAAYRERAEILSERLADIDGVTLVKPNGAYYASIVFHKEALSDSQTLPIENPQIGSIIKPLVEEVPADKRFVYYLLAAEGICTVPLSSGFHSRYSGFRMTLLETDIEVFSDTAERIAASIRDFLQS